MALGAVGIALAGAGARASAWLELVAAEIPSWHRALLGQVAEEPPASDRPLASTPSSASAPLPVWKLEVDPGVLAAASLLRPATAATPRSDLHWFGVELVRGDARYSAQAQLLGGGDSGLRARFTGKQRPDGMREIEFSFAPAAAALRTWFERESARGAGLVAAPGGFARLSINGAEPTLVAWSEGASDAMLQRLGRAAGAIVEPRVAPRRGVPERSAREAFEAAPGDASIARRLERLAELVSSPDDDAFHRELGEHVDIDALLAWNALARSLASEPAEPGWYFDPIRGWLVPVVDHFDSSRAPRAGSLAARVVDRLVLAPEYAARRAALLSHAGLASRALAAADEGLGALSASMISAEESWRRPARLAELASARRALRASWRAGSARAERSFANQLAASSRDATACARADDSTAAAANARALRADLAARGLAFRVTKSAVNVPAGTHRIEQTWIVPRTHRLVIEPGARIAMAPRASVVAHRSLRAVGTRRAPIAIFAADTKRPWGSIGVVGASETSELAYVTVSGGSSARIDGVELSGQLAFNASDVSIRDSDVIGGHGDDSLSVKRSLFEVRRTRFLDNASDGFDAEWSQGAVEQSLFASNGDDGVDLAASDVRIERTWFRSMGDKAVSAGERSAVRIVDSQIVDSQIAVASKEDSRTEVVGTEIRRNEIGISLYRDNEIFGNGFGVVTGGLFSENLRDFAVQSGSGLTLNGVERRATEPDGVVVGLRSPVREDTISIQ